MTCLLQIKSLLLRMFWECYNSTKLRKNVLLLRKFRNNTQPPHPPRRKKAQVFTLGVSLMLMRVQLPLPCCRSEKLGADAKWRRERHSLAHVARSAVGRPCCSWLNMAPGWWPGNDWFQNRKWPRPSWHGAGGLNLVVRDVFLDEGWVRGVGWGGLWGLSV